MKSNSVCSASSSYQPVALPPQGSSDANSILEMLGDLTEVQVDLSREITRLLNQIGELRRNKPTPPNTENMSAQDKQRTIASYDQAVLAWRRQMDNLLDKVDRLEKKCEELEGRIQNLERQLPQAEARDRERARRETEASGGSHPTVPGSDPYATAREELAEMKGLRQKQQKTLDLARAFMASGCQDPAKFVKDFKAIWGTGV